MSKGKRVLIMISSLGGGGAERIATRLASELSRRHEVYLLPFSTTERPYPVADEVHVVDGALYDLRQKKPRPQQLLRLAHTALSVVPAIVRLRRTKRIDTTISMLLGPNILNVVAPGGGRKVLCERNNPARKGAVRFALSKWVYRHGDAVVFQSNHVRSLFSKRVQERGVIIPNPVEVTCVAAPVEQREELIVSAGRLVAQKNHGLLIRSFARFASSHPGYELRIYGDGPLRTSLEALAAELGLEGRVGIEPFSETLHEDMRTAQVFVLSSNFEGMPNSLLEAMTMGLPCVVTAFPSADELLKDGENALVVPVGDEAAMAGAMARLADDEELRTRIEAGALARAADFTIDAVMPQWEAIL